MSICASRRTSQQTTATPITSHLPGSFYKRRTHPVSSFVPSSALHQSIKGVFACIELNQRPCRTPVTPLPTTHRRLQARALTSRTSLFSPLSINNRLCPHLASLFHISHRSSLMHSPINLSQAFASALPCSSNHAPSALRCPGLCCAPGLSYQHACASVTVNHFPNTTAPSRLPCMH